MSYLEDISLTTRLFHSNDLSELVDAICEVEGQDQDAGARLPLLLAAEPEKAGPEQVALQTGSQVNDTHE